MATETSSKKAKATDSRPANAARRRPTQGSSASKSRSDSQRQRGSSDAPPWLATVMSVVGVGVAVGAGLYASRHQWLPKAKEWRDDFSAAYADDETDYENFDQTRHAGADSMRDHPGDDWEDIDDMSDASFPASDPPSFNPGTAG